MNAAGSIRATAILPVKRFAEAKQRLSDVLAAHDRVRLAAAMLDDVLTAIARSELIERVLIISREPELTGVAAAHRARLIADQRDDSHSNAALIGIEAALVEGAGTVALLPGDCPLLDPAELDRALAGLGERVVGVIPDRHGAGTNGLLCRPPDVIEPAFGPGSRERHLRLAAAAGGGGEVIEIASLALDLDTGGDLEQLRLAAAAGRLSGSHTAAALAEIDSQGPG